MIIDEPDWATHETCDGNTDPVSSFACFVRGPVRFINDQRGQRLLLMDCIIGPNRFWYQETGDLFNSERFSIGVDVHMGIKPDLSVCVMARHIQ